VSQIQIFLEGSQLIILYIKTKKTNDIHLSQGHCGNGFVYKIGKSGKLKQNNGKIRN
jgi:hypothetical protein